MNVKIRTTDQLIKYRITDKEIVDQWDNVRKSILSVIDYRNHLVHWHVMAIASQEFSGAILTRSLDDQRTYDWSVKTTMPFKDIISTSDIIDITERFTKILNELIRCHSTLMKHLSSQKTHP